MEKDGKSIYNLEIGTRDRIVIFFPEGCSKKVNRWNWGFLKEKRSGLKERKRIREKGKVLGLFFIRLNELLLESKRL